MGGQCPRLSCSRTGAVYEGKELVLFLGIPTLTVEAWDNGVVDGRVVVQRSGDDPPRVVERNIRLARTSEQRARMNLTLAELERQVKAAATNRVAVTGGRVGIASDLPMLVTDANNLRTHTDLSASSTTTPPKHPPNHHPYPEPKTPKTHPPTPEKTKPRPSPVTMTNHPTRTLNSGTSDTLGTAS